MKRVFLGLSVGAIAGSFVIGGNGAIAASDAEIDSSIRKFNGEVENYARSRSYLDNRSSDEKKKINSLKAAWSVNSPDIAQFLGNWSANEEMKKIYPSRTKGKVCIIDTFLAGSDLGYEFSVGEVRKNRIYTSKNVVLFITKISSGSVLGTVFTREDNGQLSSYGYANPRPLISPSQSDHSENIHQLAPQFKANGCMAGLPEGAIVQRPTTSPQPIVNLSNRPNTDTWEEAIAKGGINRYIQSDYDLPSEYRQGYVYRVQGANWVGAYIFKTGLSSYPPVVTEGLNQIEPGNNWVREGKAIYFNWYLGFNTSRNNDSDVRSVENGSGCFRTTCLSTSDWNDAQVRQTLLSGRKIGDRPIAQRSTPPLQPIASSIYAYPSPSEFTQFKKNLKPSPVPLSATDRKLRQDFQAEWQKKNRAIAPYVGAWKTTDNQDIYVFPSTVSQRACVVQQNNGKLEMKLAISLTADMRFAGNTGMFKVEPMTDVVAVRSDKSEPLSALYGTIGSPEVSDSVKEDLVQARCITELPKETLVRRSFSSN